MMVVSWLFCKDFSCLFLGPTFRMCSLFLSTEQSCSVRYTSPKRRRFDWRRLALVFLFFFHSRFFSMAHTAVP
jgi:hypothetical protein